MGDCSSLEFHGKHLYSLVRSKLCVIFLSYYSNQKIEYLSPPTINMYVLPFSISFVQVFHPITNELTFLEASGFWQEPHCQQPLLQINWLPELFNMFLRRSLTLHILISLQLMYITLKLCMNISGLFPLCLQEIENSSSSQISRMLQELHPSSYLRSLLLPCYRACTFNHATSKALDITGHIADWILTAISRDCARPGRNIIEECWKNDWDKAYFRSQGKISGKFGYYVNYGTSACYAFKDRQAYFSTFPLYIGKVGSYSSAMSPLWFRTFYIAVSYRSEWYSHMFLEPRTLQS